MKHKNNFSGVNNLILWILPMKSDPLDSVLTSEQVVNQLDPLTMEAFWVPVHHMMFSLHVATELNHCDRLVLLLRVGCSFVLQLANCGQTSCGGTKGGCERPVCPPAAVTSHL